METFQLKTDFGTFKNCILVVDEYANGGTYLEVEDLEEGPICDCSVWVDGTPLLEENQFFSKEYDGVDKVMPLLEKLGIVKKMEGVKWFQGFGSYQAYELLPTYKKYVPTKKAQG